MPLFTRLFIKTSLICLIVALCCGLLLALRPMFAMPLLPADLTPVYFHLFMVGWVTQIIMGVLDVFQTVQRAPAWFQPAEVERIRTA